MVFAPSLANLKAAVSQATTLWGGIYQPLFEPSDARTLRWKAGRYGVDVVHALDNAMDDMPQEELDGYRWRGSGDWGPLAAAADYPNSRLLGPESFADQWSAHDPVLPSWDAEDPLDLLFRVWFGSYDNGQQQAVNLKRAFAASS
jgi:hypothetical protein